jgi:hypothetical protein
MEYWVLKIGGMGKRCFRFPMKVLSMTCYHSTIPPFHYSIIPGWNKKNGWLRIPYYQGFVEFQIDIIIEGYDAGF